MTLEAILASLHLVAILTLVTFMASQAAMCRIEWMNAAVVERLVRLDIIYQVAMASVLVTGLVRVFWGIKGVSWYATQPLLHLKITLFVVMVILSIAPTLAFRRWRRNLRSTAMLPGGGFVVLDTEVTPELAREGVARDLVRAVQQARRDAGFEVSDRISLTVTGAQEVYYATVHHQDLLVEETLASQFGSAPNLLAIDGDGVTEVEVGDGYHARILVKRLS